MSERMHISFKENERDMYLYNLVQSKNDKSDFIKDCIEFRLKYEKAILYFQKSRDSDELIDEILNGVK